MEKALLARVTEKTQALLAAPSCCAEAKAAAQSWLAAVGTDKEAEATKAYIAELEEDIMPIDGLLAFVTSAQGESLFGQQQAAAMAEHARQRKAAGAAYCDCPACAAVEAILREKDAMLG